MSSPEENALAVTDEERALAFYEENQEATDVPDSAGIPRIAVVQPMSDQLNPSKVGFVEGAQPGEFSHSISGETYTSLLVTPIRYAETIVHWESADADGKRPLGTYAKGCPDVPPHDMIDGWKMEAKDGSFLQPALQFVLWVRDAESGIDLGPALFVAKSTGLKYARKWKDRFLLKMGPPPEDGRAGQGPVHRAGVRDEVHAGVRRPRHLVLADLGQGHQPHRHDAPRHVRRSPGGRARRRILPH